METFLINTFIFVFGLIVGSFLNVCIYRIPRDKSIVAPRSACPHCGQAIAWYDNIPLLSYIILVGKCRHCNNSISYRYFLVEFLTALSFVLFFNFGQSRGGAILGLIYLSYISALIVCTFVDFEFFVIPDVITLPGIAAGILFSLISPELTGAVSHFKGMLNSVIGAAVGGIVLFSVAMIAGFILKKEAMGMGDVKLIAMIGAFMGWKLVLLTIFFSSFLGSMVGGVLIMMRKAKMQSAIPFGPYLCLGSIIAILWGSELINWYLSLLFRRPM